MSRDEPISPFRVIRKASVRASVTVFAASARAPRSSIGEKLNTAVRIRSASSKGNNMCVMEFCHAGHQCGRRCRSPHLRVSARPARAVPESIPRRNVVAEGLVSRVEYLEGKKWANSAPTEVAETVTPARLGDSQRSASAPRAKRPRQPVQYLVAVVELRQHVNLHPRRERVHALPTHGPRALW